MHIKKLTIEEFNNFANRFEYKSLYQTPEYAFVMENQNYDTAMLGLVNGDEVIAASIISIEKKFGFKYAYASRGFLIDYRDYNLIKKFTYEIKKYLSKNEVMAIKISPAIIKNTYDAKTNINDINPYYESIFEDLNDFGYYHFGYNNFFESLKPRYEAIVDIENAENTFNNFRKELRTKIRSAEDYGIKIIRGNDQNLEYLYLHTKNKYPRDLDYFKDIYYSFEQRGLVDFYYAKLDPMEYYNSIKKAYDKCEQEQAEITHQLQSSKNLDHNNSLVEQKMEIDKQLSSLKKKVLEASKLLKESATGIILASALIIKEGDGVYLLMDGYDTEYQTLNAKHLLIWKLMEQYSKSGYKRFNLGGMTNINVASSRYEGLNTFKLSFSPKIVEYIGDLELITNLPLYFMYRNSKPIRNLINKHFK